MAEEVKLFGMWASPFSRRVELALKLKGIPYEYIEEDLSNKSSLLLQYNPVHKKVPLLVHKGKPVAESLVILEYIDETWKNNPLLPEDPYDRAMARFWAKFIDEKLLPTSARIGQSTGKEQEQVIEEVHHHLKTLENLLKGKEFFAGHSIGYMDIAANIFFWFYVNEEISETKVLTAQKYPTIYEWIKKLKNIDAVKECLVEKEKFHRFIISLREASKSK
ncbi:hypothetical protein COLO4_18606 [Corchorus olitorius]|uniref:glutathione transferase n=1 Tax=Corchorus olitorius TaxID=93759 RepID=A0A1R3J8I5_9ROSI|nr:hypothetical protein COLO4_18606 [Corchorus olitorius]